MVKRFSTSFPLLGALGLFFLSSAADGATRLTYMVQGRPTAITWSADAFPIAYRVDPGTVTRMPAAKAVAGRAFDSWTSVDTAVKFSEDTSAAASSGKDGVNAISLNDQLFSGSGFVAFTTTWFDDNGRIIEADIQVDSSVVGDSNRLESLLQHEIGHFLGLDHSGVISSTMYPFVGTSLSRLDTDDRIAIAGMYPITNASVLVSALRGEARGSSGPLFGVQVVAVNDRGSPVASALTDREGRFEITGLPEGKYKLYVEPLDGPVDPQNLSGYWREAQKVVFRTEFLSSSTYLDVRAGGVHEGLMLNATQPTTLSPRWIGTFPVGSTDIKLGSTVNTIKAGETVSIAVGGDGFVGGLTEFQVMNSHFARVSDYKYGPNYVWATFKVAADAPAGSLVMLVANGTETTTLTGGLRIDGNSGGGRRRPVR